MIHMISHNSSRFGDGKITLRPRKSCDFLGQPLPTISRSPTAGLLGIGLDCDVTAMSGSQHAVSMFLVLSLWHVLAFWC